MPDLFDLHMGRLIEVSFTRRRKNLKDSTVMNGAANEHADILVCKSKSGGLSPEETGKKEAPQMAENTELEKMASDLAEADTTIAKQAGEIETLEKRIGDLEADLRSRGKDLDDVKRDLDRELAKHEDPEEALLKTMPEAAQKAFLAQKAATERLEKRLAEADEQAKLAEIAKSFDAEFSGLPTKGSDMAPILKSVYGVLEEEQATELRRVLKAGAEAMTELLKVHGMTGGGNTQAAGAEAELDKLAKARAEKDGLTFAKAYSAVVTENPSLYEKYRAEQTH